MTAKRAVAGEVAVRPPAVAGESFDDVFRQESLGMVRLAFLMVGSPSLAEEIVRTPSPGSWNAGTPSTGPWRTCARVS